MGDDVEWKIRKIHFDLERDEEWIPLPSENLGVLGNFPRNLYPTWNY